jgi:hypothetical protein
MRYELNPAGWIWWPEREDLSLEFMRLLAAAQDGGSTVSECWLTAARIDFTDDESWHREWTRAAEMSRARAVAAAAGGNRVTARSNWLRAINYYQAAAYPFELAPDRQQAAVAAMRECAANYLQHREPRGEVVSISWLEEFPLQGYFLPAPPTGEPAPVVISIGEPGHRGRVSFQGGAPRPRARHFIAGGRPAGRRHGCDVRGNGEAQQTRTGDRADPRLPRGPRRRR